MSSAPATPLINRELSWLAFNGRVLQEAGDPSVPLFDRLGFLAIFSANLDEFFRVRVASLRARLRADEEEEEPGEEAAEVLRQIHAEVGRQQKRFGAILARELLPALAEAGLRLGDPAAVPAGGREELGALFRERAAPHLAPTLLADDAAPFLKNRAIYLVVELSDAEGERLGLVEVPSTVVPRFLRVPGEGAEREVWYLDDLIRLHLGELFPGYRVRGAYAVKISRDAELYLDPGAAGSIAEAVRSSLPRRETGLPCRFLFDESMPVAMLEELESRLGLQEEDLIRGGRYHNLHDLRSFPRPERPGLASEPLPPLPHPLLQHADSILDAVEERDHLLHFPYQSYDYLLRFAREAATDPRVEEIWVTLYRVAAESAVVEAMMEAARRGKRVTAVVEVQARFDEGANLHWAERMSAAGVRTIYGAPGLKVHAKLLLLSRGDTRLACLATGNFNEQTARIYGDHALLTSLPELTGEVHSLFRHLAGETPEPVFRHLLVAPFQLREQLARLVEREIGHARAGEPAGMVLKMNSLEDPEMIELLYRASGEGVETDLIVRGICCLAAGVPATSERIRARSIVDRFLEHARVFVFHHAGADRVYLASADLMRRNLNRRIEVAFPVADPELRAELLEILRLQLADDRKARELDPEMRNELVGGPAGPGHRSQLEIYEMLRARARVGPREETRGTPHPEEIRWPTSAPR